MTDWAAPDRRAELWGRRVQYETRVSASTTSIPTRSSSGTGGTTMHWRVVSPNRTR
jgi:hypothetical protein